MKKIKEIIENIFREKNRRRFNRVLHFSNSR